MKPIDVTYVHMCNMLHVDFDFESNDKDKMKMKNEKNIKNGETLYIKWKSHDNSFNSRNFLKKYKYLYYIKRTNIS